MWVEKYKPKKLSEVVGQKEIIEKIKNWFIKWKPGDKALMFYGPSGTGKTCISEALANEKNYDFIEMNASDVRSALRIREVFGHSMTQQSLFKGGKIFLIDEIEGLFGKEDFGGVGEIIKIIKESKHRIILTSNDPWDPRLRSLRAYCQLIQFRKVPYWDIVKRLQFICEKEGVKCDKEVLQQIAKRSEGDLRSAINDLESLAMRKKEIKPKDLEVLGMRERETSIFESLKIIFKTQTALSAKLSIQNVDKDPDEIFLWIEQNIINEYEKPEEIAKAYEMLSRADLFMQRVKSRQDWKFEKYMIDLMTAGVALAKKEMYRKFSKYQYPDRMIFLGRTKVERKEEKEKLLELSKSLHCSTKKIKKEFLPFFKLV
jgi:replication factor C large subunit